jgi:hypothetical protein
MALSLDTHVAAFDRGGQQPVFEIVVDVNGFIADDKIFRRRSRLRRVRQKSDRNHDGKVNFLSGTIKRFNSTLKKCYGFKAHH